MRAHCCTVLPTETLSDTQTDNKTDTNIHTQAQTVYH